MRHKKGISLFIFAILGLLYLFILVPKSEAGCSIVCYADMCGGGKIKNPIKKPCKICESICTPEPTPSCINYAFAGGAISTSPLYPSQVYQMRCNYGSRADCITPVIPNSGCTLVGFENFTALFNCTAPTTAGAFIASCSTFAGTANRCCPRTDIVGTYLVAAKPTPVCERLHMMCKRSCGEPTRCASDGCGGQVCCNATEPCAPACIDSDGGANPDVAGSVTVGYPATPGVYPDRCVGLNPMNTSATPEYIAQTAGTHVEEKTCANVATGQVSSSVIRCVNGCVNGACSATPQCSLRSQGDANCNNVVDKSDYDMLISSISGLKNACLNCSTDFNGDNTTNLLDFEIWRNTVYK